LSELGGPLGLGGATLSGAGSVAVAPASGWTYVADSNHNRVLGYGPEGWLRLRVGAAGGHGSAGAGRGEFNHPAAVALDASGDIYLADRGNNRIVKLSPGGDVLAQWGSLGTGTGHFNAPSGVAVDARQRVFVVDSLNNRIEVFDAGGGYLTRWGLRGTAAGEFSHPTAIAVDCYGKGYVADTNNNRIERFSLANGAPSGCLPAGAWPPPLDVAPVLHVRLARRAGVLGRRALALRVSCERGCKLLVTATLLPGAGRRRVRLIPLARSLPRAVPGHVRLRVGPSALRRLRRGLGRRSGLFASVKIVEDGANGRSNALVRR